MHYHLSELESAFSNLGGLLLVPTPFTDEMYAASIHGSSSKIPLLYMARPQLLILQLLQVHNKLSWKDRYFLTRIETVCASWRYFIGYVGKGET